MSHPMGSSTGPTPPPEPPTGPTPPPEPPTGPTPPPEPPTRAGRPATVTGAAVVLVFMALAGLVNAVIALLSVQGVTDRFRSAADAAGARGSDVEAFVAALRIGLAVGLILALVVAVLLVTLAAGLMRGSAGARIATWVLCGLGALCGVCGLVFLVGQRLVPVTGDSADGDVLRALNEAYPPWWLVLNGAISFGQTMGYLLVALLLALPASNQFFRRRRAEQQTRTGPNQVGPPAVGPPAVGPSPVGPSPVGPSSVPRPGESSPPPSPRPGEAPPPPPASPPYPPSQP